MPLAGLIKKLNSEIKQVFRVFYPKNDKVVNTVIFTKSNYFITSSLET